MLGRARRLPIVWLDEEEDEDEDEVMGSDFLLTLLRRRVVERTPMAQERAAIAHTRFVSMIC